jgi:hypothetical protein
MSAQTELYDTASADPDNGCCDAPKHFCDSPHSAVNLVIMVNRHNERGCR